MTERKVVICCGFGSKRIERSPLSHPWTDRARQAFAEGEHNPASCARTQASPPCLQREVFPYERATAASLISVEVHTAQNKV